MQHIIQMNQMLGTGGGPRGAYSRHLHVVSHVPVLGKLLAHPKARLGCTKQPRKAAEGYDPGPMELLRSHKPETSGGKPVPGIQGEELPPSYKSM